MNKLLLILYTLLMFSCTNNSESVEGFNTNLPKDSNQNTIVTGKTKKEKEDSIINSLHKDTEVGSADLSKIKERLKHSNNVSDRPLKLAEYLETAAFIIKTESTRYNWSETGSCNVGIIAQLVTGLTPLQIESCNEKYPLPEKKYKGNWTWSGAVSQYCPLTGKSKIEILDKIMSAGMEREDFYHLEYLDNKEILRHANSGNSLSHTNEKHLILYMETWADMIRKYKKGHPEIESNTEKKIEKKIKKEKTSLDSLGKSSGTEF